MGVVGGFAICDDMKMLSYDEFSDIANQPPIAGEFAGQAGSLGNALKLANGLLCLTDGAQNGGWRPHPLTKIDLFAHANSVPSSIGGLV
jgi:hypothetical protein